MSIKEQILWANEDIFETQIPFHEDDWRCTICHAKPTSINPNSDRQFLQEFHLNYESPICSKAMRIWNLIQSVKDISETHEYHCACGESHHGWSRYTSHRDSCQNSTLRGAKAKEVVSEKNELTQSVMVLACIKAGAHHFSEIRSKHEELFAKKISDSNLSGALKRLQTDRKITKQEDGTYLVSLDKQSEVV